MSKHLDLPTLPYRHDRGDQKMAFKVLTHSTQAPRPWNELPNEVANAPILTCSRILE